MNSQDKLGDHDGSLLLCAGRLVNEYTSRLLPTLRLFYVCACSYGPHCTGQCFNYVALVFISLPVKANVAYAYKPMLQCFFLCALVCRVNATILQLCVFVNQSGRHSLILDGENL